MDEMAGCIGSTDSFVSVDAPMLLAGKSKLDKESSLGQITGSPLDVREVVLSGGKSPDSAAIECLDDDDTAAPG